MSAVVSFGQAPATFSFAILGDRTGETEPGVYEAVWADVARRKPAFVASVGDSVQGGSAATLESEWREFDRLLAPYRSIPFVNTPGNHDIWSDTSARAWSAHSGRPLHYGFDSGPVHITVLDNSRSNDLPVDELSFLESDLRAHRESPVKLVIMHRPSWLVPVMLKDTAYPLQQLAERYGVQAVIAGHVHEMMHAALNGVEYISAPSAGGHLRASGQFEDGWFFGYLSASVTGNRLEIEVRQLGAPFGAARVTPVGFWGAFGAANPDSAGTQ